MGWTRRPCPGPGVVVPVSPFPPGWHIGQKVFTPGLSASLRSYGEAHKGQGLPGD